MVDMFAPSAASGLTTPMLIQAQQSDPRVALARAMSEQATQSGPPLLSPYSALAKALQTGLAGVTNVGLGQEYQQRQKDFGDTVSRALQAGQSGTTAWTNPDTGEAVGENRPPGFDALASVLSQSNDPAAQQMALQYGIQNLTTKQGAQIAFAQELAKKGLMIDPRTSQIVELPNYGPAVGGVKQAESQGEAKGKAVVDLEMQPKIIQATTPAKAALAGAEKSATEAAELPFVGPKTTATEKAKLPFEVVPVHGVGAFPKSTILGTAPPPPAQSTAPSILSQAGYDALPKGTPYRAPDGQIRVKQ